ncbi:MAG: hypothetical protein KME21_22595 [Desmonostoc vinosum HA7617-LM4]|jgi:hypothetical protein|nr:hypothetical protein [Desmonostoc vinosum HA7617-LM4]
MSQWLVPSQLTIFDAINQSTITQFWANIIRYYTSEVHLLWKTRKIEFLKPTEVGFVCIVSISNRRG